MGAEVYVVLRRWGTVHIFTSESKKDWPPSLNDIGEPSYLKFTLLLS